MVFGKFENAADLRAAVSVITGCAANCIGAAFHSGNQVFIGAWNAGQAFLNKDAEVRFDGDYFAVLNANVL